MLDIIKKLDSGTIKGLLVVTIPLLVVIGAMFGLDEAIFRAQLEAWGEKVLLVVSLGGAAFAAYARLFRPSPPLTQTAVDKTVEALQKGDLTASSLPPGTKAKQGGFARLALLALLLALGAPLLLSIAGCETLGLAQPQGWDQRVAYSRGQLTGFVNATASAVEKGTVDKEDGRRVLDLAKQARDVLEAADTAQLAGDIQTAEGRYALALGILTQLQAFIDKRNAP